MPEKISGRGLFTVLLFLMMPACQLLAEETTIHPKSAAGPLDNPLKGWCPYPDGDAIHQPYSMVFQYVSWRQLEPNEGEFRFEEWEKSWESKASKEKHIIFRVYIDYPKKESGLPDWLRKAGVKETAYDDYGGGKSPDYDDPRMIAGMERLIAALGKRYNRNPRIAFIQLGLLGFWGEWHTYPKTTLYASAKTERRVVEAYRKAFPDKSLMVRYSRDYAGQQEWIGFHDDMFPEDTDNGQDWSFLSGLRKTKRTENWRQAVVGGEMVPDQAERWLGKEFDATQTTLQRAHFTWVGPYCPAHEKKGDQFRQRSAQLIRKMGYEYQISEVAHSATMKPKQPTTLSIKGKNTGVAPFYYPWTVECALLDSTGKVKAIKRTDWDIRTWQPGDFIAKTDIDFDVSPGNYRLAIGIRDPWKNKPAIRFANQADVVDGWTVFSELRVVD